MQVKTTAGVPRFFCLLSLVLMNDISTKTIPMRISLIITRSAAFSSPHAIRFSPEKKYAIPRMIVFSLK